MKISISTHIIHHLTPMNPAGDQTCYFTQTLNYIPRLCIECTTDRGVKNTQWCACGIRGETWGDSLIDLH